MSETNSIFTSNEGEAGDTGEVEPYAGLSWPAPNHQESDQREAEKRDDLKRSATRLLEILKLNCPKNMVFRELAILTERCGSYQNSLLDIL